MDHRGVPPMVFSGNLAENWKFWKQRFMVYLQATEISKKEDVTKCAQLLTLIGEEGIRIFNTFKIEEANKDKLDVLIKYFDEYFNPKKNVTFERYKFLTCKQKEGQSVENYVTLLKGLAQSCELGTLEENLVKDVMICGLVSEPLREKLLLEEATTLNDAIRMCVNMESTRERNKQITNGSTSSAEQEIHVVRRGSQNGTSNVRNGPHRSHHHHQRAPAMSSKMPAGFVPCPRCGSRHAQHQRCPAQGVQCFRCKKFNHFGQVCNLKYNSFSNSSNFKNKNNYKQFSNKNFSKFQNKKVDTIDEIESDNFIVIDWLAEQTLATDIDGVSSASGETWTEVLRVEDQNVEFKLDTGAMADVIPVSLVRSLNISNKNIQKTKTVLCSYSQNKLPVLGQIKLNCSFGRKDFALNFYVVDLEGVPILGLKTCINLNLVQKVKSINDVSRFKNDTDSLLGNYKFLFNGIGCLKKPYRIDLKENATPVVHPVRKVPFALQEKFKNVLDELVKQKIIEKSFDSDEWVNAFVLVRKPNGSLRLCLDPADLNRAVKRHYFKVPTLEELTIQFGGAKYFTTLDATQGFLQVPLHSESSKLCTFGTPWGRYRFLRLPYGLNSAPEVFQERMHEIFGEIEGVSVYIDDIIICAKSVEEHNVRLEKVLATAAKHNIRFNKGKCKFLVNRVKYMGHEISESGLKPDDSKIEAIKNMPRPENKTDIQRFLGYITYVGKFIQNLSELTAPLRSLLKKDISFSWEHCHEQAFNKLKEMASQRPCLQFFDMNKETTISVDSSQKGMAAILMQDGRPCAYASRSLTQAQERYSQIEKELLSCFFGIDRFSQFVYGKHFYVETDHKPLIQIIKKPLNQCPARLQRILIQLKKYDFTLTYKPGKKLIIADTFSRAFEKNKYFNEQLDLEVEAQICLISMQLNATPERIKELQNNTNRDRALSLLKNYILNGWPRSYKQIPDIVKIYYKFRAELNIIRELVYKGQKLIVPELSRKYILEKIHYSHLGINKCLMRARNSFFWPGMNNQIKDIVSTCHLCQENQPNQQSEPMVSHDAGEYPFEKVGTDIFHLFGRSYLLVVDYYSKYVDALHLGNDLSSHNIINKLKSVFSKFGLPRIVFSDGGPEFSSYEFAKFSNKYAFQHIKSSPRYPQSNGAVERAIRTVKSVLRKCFLDRKDPYLALLDLRNTPIDGENSPANILMSRNLRSQLPQINQHFQPKLYNRNKFNTFLRNSKQRQKFYYDNKGVKKLEDLKLNCNVWLQVKPSGPWQRGKIIQRLGYRAYKVQLQNGRIYVRNRRFIRPCKISQSSHNSTPFYTQSLPLVTQTDEYVYIPIVENENFVSRLNESNVRVENRETSVNCSSEVAGSSRGHLECDVAKDDVPFTHVSVGSDESVENNYVSDESLENNLNNKTFLRKRKEETQGSDCSSLQNTYRSKASLVPNNFVTRTGRQIKRPTRYSHLS